MCDDYPLGVNSGNFDKLCWGIEGYCSNCGTEIYEWGEYACEDCKSIENELWEELEYEYDDDAYEDEFWENVCINCGHYYCKCGY